MNKAITDGILFMPPAFEHGLAQWSKGDGTPGSDTYAGDPGAAIVTADADFGGCLELLKGSTVQKLRFTGETPILPGCYLRIRARIKAVSGNLPSVRIAGWAGGSSGAHAGGLVEAGPEITLTSYGTVTEVSAIVGTGARPGVDMVWGAAPVFGHFGLDLTGANGGVVRIDDIVIEDITSAFLREMMAWVDVRDYGAVGDGVTDDLAAFRAADAAAGGRAVLVSEGRYHLGDSMTFQNRAVFQGTLAMDTASVLSLTRNFDLPAYVDAFADEELAFRKAFQALLNGSGHEGLDLGGRRITVTEPIDMQAAVANKTAFATRRHIRNGQFEAASSSAWDTETVTSSATYAAAADKTLTGVTNVANIPVGALVEAAGVGREVYVAAKNVAAQEVTLSNPLYDAEGTRVFTFRRFKYLLDFSGFQDLDKFSMSDIEFQCNGRASGILLAPSGIIFALRDCFVSRPKDRGITSHGTGCQGMLIDRCQFLSNESALSSQDRTSVALNANANDVKLRDNRALRFRHFAVLGGTGSIVTGNHFFQGDAAPDGIRLAGLVFTQKSARATVTGNYIDNCFVEWGNEHDAAPGFSNELSFSGLSVTDNIMFCSHVAPWFTFFVIKPHGPGHFLNGLTVTGNVFRVAGDNIDRVEMVDTSFAGLDFARSRNVSFTDNLFNQISEPVENPTVVRHAQGTAARVWTVPGAPRLPFGGWTREVESVMARSAITTEAGTRHHGVPFARTGQGAGKSAVALEWEMPVKGDVTVRMRMDDPL